MFEALKKPHYVSSGADQVASSVESVFNFAEQGTRFQFQRCHAAEVVGEAGFIIIKVVLYSVPEYQDSIVNDSEQLVYALYKFVGVLVRKNTQQAHFECYF